MKTETEKRMTTKKIDEIIQPYYQKAELDYQKKKKGHIAWDLWFLIFAVILIVYEIFFNS